MTIRKINLGCFLAFVIALMGCGDSASNAGGTGGGNGDDKFSAPQFLSEWGLFENIPEQIPVQGIIPYEVTSPLFSDYATKFRFVRIPEGEQIQYSNIERWQNPLGALYVKTFAYPVDVRDPESEIQLIETRIIAFNQEKDVVDMWTYVYPEDSNEDAELVVWGPTIDVDFINSQGNPVSLNYKVPSTADCRSCHGTGERQRTLGPSSGMLNRDHNYGSDLSPNIMNQINYMENLGLFSPKPPPADSGERTTYVTNPADPAPTPDEEDFQQLHDRVRSYFNSNCSHCHAPDGEASNKGLFLNWENMDLTNLTIQDLFTWGVCKSATSAGNGTTCTQGHDIVPGNTDESLLLCRLNSVTSGERMPPLGRTVVHEEAVTLIQQWITRMPELSDIIPGLQVPSTCGRPSSE